MSCPHALMSCHDSCHALMSCHVIPSRTRSWKNVSCLQKLTQPRHSVTQRNFDSFLAPEHIWEKQQSKVTSKLIKDFITGY